MLVAITVALVSRFGSNKASDAGKTAQSVTNEGALSAAPATSVSEQATTAPDNSEIITSTDLYGVKTETRTFKSHARVARVVLTTAEGRQVAEVLSHAGEARELPQEKVVTALDATGDSLADAVGFAGSPVEESKGGLAAQTENRKSSPAVKGPVRKNTVGTKPSDASVSGPNQTSTPLGGTQSTEQKTTQTADNPKERFVKGIQKTSNTQPRAKF